MKLALTVLLSSLLSASAYNFPLQATRAVKGTKAVKGKPSSGMSPSAAAWAAANPSVALPFATAPATLDGSMLGDVGFDPWGFSTTPVGPWILGKDQYQINGLDWYREAEVRVMRRGL